MAANWSGGWLGRWLGKWLGAQRQTAPVELQVEALGLFAPDVDNIVMVSPSFTEDVQAFLPDVAAVECVAPSYVESLAPFFPDFTEEHL